MFLKVENGEVYSPKALGTRSILVAADKIAKIASKLPAFDIECKVVDASGCFVVPGFIDPHEHISGAGGEEGFASRTPEVQIKEIATAGITTVVGLIGTDATTRTLPALLAKARQLELEGISTFIYTGSFQVPVRTLTGSVVDDLVLVDKVIGTGELALSDYRSSEPAIGELARVVSDGIIGGMIGGKAGVTHFHVGEGQRRLSLLHTLLTDYDIPPKFIYPTHIERNAKLMDDAIALAKRGSFVDIDTVEPGLEKWLLYYMEHDGALDRLTISSDAHASTPANTLHDEFAVCARSGKIKLEKLLPFFTTNVAAALQLRGKGKLEEGEDADILVLDKTTFDVVHLIARGVCLVLNRKVVAKSEYAHLA